MLIRFEERCWRMLGVRWQNRPLSGEGAAKTGGRWNRPGQVALYMSRDHGTAISEFHQSLVRPGTLVGYDIVSDKIADLTDYAPWNAEFSSGAKAAFLCDWKAIWKIEAREPPTWRVAAMLIDRGAHGALVPSAQREGAVNLVLWHWGDDADGDGASVRFIDPHADLGREPIRRL